ncbi:MoaD/ThiS family protein [Flavihumibacter rivuli]|uniref:MoaD/ThiS family protein n=1 Tax=Flavihumibacter rivuli TaxID=2838156 RepID=UPI001BDF25DC|nr:MoaD/ThiS family protein [Flavihumibacter rivuli]ULQ54875.1 MoaD/ThiS family protein [Flavihumibacter rivuli]
MNIQITIFGQLTDITGSNSISIPAVSNTDELFMELKKQFPALEKAKFVVAVDKKIIHGTAAITANSSIALLPPFSGG